MAEPDPGIAAPDPSSRLDEFGDHLYACAYTGCGTPTSPKTWSRKRC